jgi:hypothetical protein
MAFTDYMGQYLQNRMDQATRPFTDTEGYAADRLGFETEEERRKRLEREAAQRGNTEVSSTTVKSYQDGSQEQVVKTQIPAAQQPVSAPVNPADTYQRMIQAESGGRQFGPDGQVLTSPKGAMGVGQVMPATAMQPGYGVTNIFDMAEQRGMPVAQRDEATARQLLGNESLNRDFGQSYFNAMQQRFPQDPAASVAAYNAGPGRVGQNMQANAGQLNRGQLPAETQAYLQQTLGGQTQPPQAQAPAQPQAPTQLAQEPPGTAPAAGPVTPTQLAQEPPAQAPVPATDTTQPMIAGSPSSDVGLTPTEQVLQDPNMQRFTAAQNDPTAMLALAQDPTAPKWVQNLAYKQVADFAKNKNEENKANQMTDPNAIAKELGRKSSDGSWVKYYLMKRLGLNEAATQEAGKLGLTNTWKDYVIDGKSYLINTQADGLPIAGIDPESGKSIPANIYQKASVGMSKADTGKTLYKDPTGKVPGVITATTVPGQTTAIYTDQNGNRVRPGSLTPITAATDAVSAYNVGYAKSGGSAQGTQGAEGFQTGQLPPPPGMAGSPGTGGQQQTVPTTPTVPTLDAQGGAPVAKTTTGITSSVPNSTMTPVMQQQATQAAPIYQQKQNVAIQEKDREAFVKYNNEDLLPKADAGAKLAGIRRDQLYGPDGVLNNPEVAGLLSGTGSQAREFQNLFRDVVAGNFEKIDDMSTRIKASGMDERAKQVLQVQLQRQREVTPLLIREVAPVGTITDFEQRMAKDAGIDVTRQGLYAGLTNLTRSEFQSDMAAYKAAFKAQNPNLQTREQFESAWQQEKAKLDAIYRRVYEQRAQYIGKYNKDGSNNNATVVAFRDHYPTPRFNQETKQWQFQGYSKNALRPSLKEFEQR